MPYGQRWRETRRCFHQYFNQNMVQNYHAIQCREVHAFLRRSLASEKFEVLSLSQ